MAPALPPGYALRSLAPGDLDRLVEIDRAGTRLLAEHGFPSLLDHLIDRDGMERLTGGRRVWVAADGTGEAVGFAVASDPGPCLYLHELSVDPAHGRRGIGAALLAAVVAHARWAFHSAVALDTFRDVPFNAPFYRRHGFVALEPGLVPEDIRTLVERGRPPGILPRCRTVMVRRL